MTMTEHTSTFTISLSRLPKRVRELVLCLLTLAAIVLSMGIERWYDAPEIVLAMNLVAYVAGGWYGMQEAWASLRRRELDVDFLMILAAVGAAVVDQWHEGATLLFLFSLSNTLQSYAMDRSRRAIGKLMQQRPTEATILSDGEERRVPVDALCVGDHLILRPGEMLVADGIVRGGQSDMNEASVTGESKPVDKASGDTVFAGAITGSGTLDIEVTRTPDDSTLARIVELVESAQAVRSRTQRVLDEVEGYYAKAVVTGVLGFIFVPWLLMGHDFSPTFYRAMVLLVVASPCALIISTPAAMLSAIACGARNGILFKGGLHLENLAEVKVVAFDKTGTLTYGRLRVTDVVTGNNVPKDFDHDRLLGYAAALEARSEHPIAKAILQEAEAQDITMPATENFENLPGRGAFAVIEGFLVWIGGERMYQEHGEQIPEELQQRKQALEAEGKTVLVMHRELAREAEVGEHEAEGGWLGLVAVSDTMREGVADIINRIRKQGVSHVAMLTGDNHIVAETIAEAAGVDLCKANLLPEEKVDALHNLQETYGPVLMVGDGINDAPALAHASIGMAMGGAGSDIALESADIVLMSDDIARIPFAIELSNRAVHTVRRNVAFSLSVITFLVAAVFVFGLSLPLGVLGHEGSTVLVVLNGLRLLTLRDKNRNGENSGDDILQE